MLFANATFYTIIIASREGTLELYCSVLNTNTTLSMHISASREGTLQRFCSMVVANSIFFTIIIAIWVETLWHICSMLNTNISLFTFIGASREGTLERYCTMCNAQTSSNTLSSASLEWTQSMVSYTIRCILDDFPDIVLGGASLWWCVTKQSRQNKKSGRQCWFLPRFTSTSWIIRFPHSYHFLTSILSIDSLLSELGIQLPFTPNTRQ